MLPDGWHTEILNNPPFASDVTRGIDESPATISDFADFTGSINGTDKNLLASDEWRAADIPHKPSTSTSEAPTATQN